MEELWRSAPTARTSPEILLADDTEVLTSVLTSKLAMYAFEVCTVIKAPTLAFSFLLWLISRHCHALQLVPQNFLVERCTEDAAVPAFWQECGFHAKLPSEPELLAASALEVVLEYVAPGARCAVPLSAGTARILVDGAAVADVAFFDRARRELFWRLLRWVPSFRRSSHFAGTIRGDASSPTSGLGGPAGLAVQLAGCADGFAARAIGQIDPTRAKQNLKLLRRIAAERAAAVPSARTPPPKGDKHRRGKGPRLQSKRGGTSFAAASSGIGRPRVLGWASSGVPAVAARHAAAFHHHSFAILDVDDAGCGGELDPGVRHFHRKLKKGDTEDPLLRCRRVFAEERGEVWAPSDRLHAGLKSQLLTANDHMAQSPPVASWWRSPGMLQVLCRNGVLISFSLSGLGTALERVHSDPHLHGKLVHKGGIIAAVNTEHGLLLSLEGDPGFVVYHLPAVDGVESPGGGAGGGDLVVPPVGQGSRGGPRLAAAVGSVFVAAWWPRTDPAPAGNVVIHAVVAGNGGRRSQFSTMGAVRSRGELLAVFWSVTCPGVMLTLSTRSASPLDCQLELSATVVRPDGTVPSKAMHVQWDAYYPLTAAPQASGTRTLIFHGSQRVAIDFAGPAAANAASSVGDQLAIAALGGEVVVVDVTTGAVARRTSEAESPSAVAWHPSGALFAVSSGTRIFLFDSVAAGIDVCIVSDSAVPAPGLDLAAAGCHTDLTLLTWGRAPRNRPLSSVSLAVTAGGEPLALVRPAVSSGLVAAVPKTGECSGIGRAVAARLAHGELDAAADLLGGCDWDLDPGGSYAAVQKTVSRLLREPFSQRVNELIRASLPAFSWHIEEVQAQHFTVWHARVQALQRRYFNYLLRHQRLVLALHVATELKSKGMCEDLARAAGRCVGERARFVAAAAAAAAAATTSNHVSFV